MYGNKIYLLQPVPPLTATLHNLSQLYLSLVPVVGGLLGGAGLVSI